MANIDTAAPITDNHRMADRQTRNVSLPPSQDRFIRAQVRSGRFRSASEVVREGLRMLEEAEHRRLVERWLVGELTAAEERQIPPAVLKAAREHVRGLIDAGLEDAASGRVVDGPSALASLRSSKPRRRSA